MFAGLWTTSVAKAKVKDVDHKKPARRSQGSSFDVVPAHGVLSATNCSVAPPLRTWI